MVLASGTLLRRAGRGSNSLRERASVRRCRSPQASQDQLWDLV